MYLQALKQIFKITFTILLIVVIPVVIFTLITSKMPLFGIKSYVVLTGSMEPAVPMGSVIYTLKQPSYKVGDIIAFKQGDLTITHRVAAVTPEGFKTKGDANNAIDSTLVSKANVEGIQVYRFLNLGKLILSLKTLPGLLTLIILPAIILIGFEINNIRKEMEKEIRKRVLSSLRVTERNEAISS